MIEKPVLLDLFFKSHSVDISFDTAAISILELDNNLILRHVKWEGSPSGGHHLSGTLMFSSILEESKTMKLTLENITDIPGRIFVWKLK